MKRRSPDSGTSPSIRRRSAPSRTGAICAAAAAVNLTLFFLKLYVGLSSNSIAIFSDAVNNLTDCLSAILASAMMYVVASYERSGGPRDRSRTAKTEQLLSFILAAGVSAAGGIFAYNSVERLMYPTPVWFQMPHFYVILVTVFIKLGMFFFFQREEKKTPSGVLRLMKTDSILDVGVTGAALLSFTLTRYLEVAVDAAAGIAVSAVILTEAVSLIIKSWRDLTGSIRPEKREELEELIAPYADEYFLQISSDGKVTAFISADEKTEKLAAEKQQIEERTGIRVIPVPKNTTNHLIRRDTNE